MNWQDWIKQTLPRTENMRGGATAWVKGGPGLIGDTLGPKMHSHDGASEIFYFVKGKCRMEVGDSEQFFEAGDFVLVPPVVPHNLWNVEDSDLLLFWIVAPHDPHNKWRTEGFQIGAMESRVLHCRLGPGVELPADNRINSRLLSLSAGDKIEESTGSGQEAVLYIVDGRVGVQVGKLGGLLSTNHFVHVPANTPYSITSQNGAASILVFRMPDRVS
jgi:mannose-6-phosphate isomerase-like protein (cupin superfamily)